MTAVDQPSRALPVGVNFAVASALLFGLSTPCAKLLLGEMPPLLLAGLLYAGSGLGLFVMRLFLPASVDEAPLTRADLPWLAGAVVAGGILGPVLLLSGLRSTPASAASLLLNLEGVFTALLAWFVFHENFDRRIALGFALITAGAAILSRTGATGTEAALPLGAITIAAACLCWALDNNLTQKIAGADPLLIAAVKGAVAGSINLALALAAGTEWPAPRLVVGALAVGLVGYGSSLALFVLALRHLGTARTGAYFSLAPFIGAALSLVFLREEVAGSLVVAGILMGMGAWLHVTERHEHEHQHEAMEHSHRHAHDEHHQHAHEGGAAPPGAHTHAHVHQPLSHRHPHYPDTHHRHRHGQGPE